MDDKIIGMFYGVALGDALGLPYEFKRISPKIEYSRYINKVPFAIQFRFAAISVKSCSVSDDTEMTLALLKSIYKHEKYDKIDVILSYENFANNTNMLGKNTRKLFKGVKTLKGYQNRFLKLEEEEKENMQSNGSLMRASALVFTKKEDILTDTYLTNPNSVNYYCNLIYVSILKLLLLGKKKEEVKEYVIEESVNEKYPNVVRKVMTDSLGEKDERNISSKNIKGWVCSSLYIALYSFWNFEKFEEAMEFVILKHPGSDTDTNAAITGALFGAHLGIEEMKKEEYTNKNIESLKETTARIDLILKK
jgi:ADP-ribosyl-[dinitrogen reductase] hydrolase